MKKRFLVVWLPPTYDPAFKIVTMDDFLNPDNGYEERIINIASQLEIGDCYIITCENIYIFRMEDED